jgi:lysine-specific demethylase 8
MEYVRDLVHAHLQQICSTSPSDGELRKRWLNFFGTQWPLPIDLIQVSEGFYGHLVTLAGTILTGELHSINHQASEFRALSDIAHAKMRLASSSTLGAWQILYADACILRALCMLDKPNATRSIGILDEAIIIAGGGDENRLDLILSCINKIQQVFLPPRVLSRKLLHQGHHSSLNLLSIAHHEVPMIVTEPSFLSFQEIHSKAPFVIRDYARDWPALKNHRWNSVDYLLSVSGSSRIVPIEVGRDYRDGDWSQTLMSWKGFLDVIGESATDDRSGKAAKTLYLAQYNLLRQFPSLRSDIVIPDYVYCALKSQDFPEYRALHDDDSVILNTWLGPKGATSPAHFVRRSYLFHSSNQQLISPQDPYYNLYGEVVPRPPRHIS